MMFDVTIYCPDTHILYNAKLMDQKGLGGGLIARILVAQALVQHGHQVTVIANVTHPYRHRGVEYIPLADAARKTKTDILILASSGGALSLEPAIDFKLDAKWCEIRIGSVPPIRDLDQFYWDSIIPQSNFIHDVIATGWYLERPKQFVIYQGVSKLRNDCWLSSCY